MGSNKRGESKSEHIDKTNDNLISSGNEVDPLDELNELLFSNQDSIKNDENDSSLKDERSETGESLESVPGPSNQEYDLPMQNVDKDVALEPDFDAIKKSQSLQDDSGEANSYTPDQENISDIQDDDLFDLFGEDFEVSATEKPEPENVGSDEPLDSNELLQDKKGDVLHPSEPDVNPNKGEIKTKNNENEYASDSFTEDNETQVQSEPQKESEPKFESEPESELESLSESYPDPDPELENSHETEKKSDQEVELEIGSDNDTELDYEIELDPNQANNSQTTEESENELESLFEENERSETEGIDSVEKKATSTEGLMNEEDSSYEKEFLEILNEETERSRDRSKADGPQSDSHDHSNSSDTTNANHLSESADRPESGSLSGQGGDETQSQSESDIGSEIVQHTSSDPEDVSMSPKVEKQDQSEARPNNRGKLVSNFQNGARDTLELDLEEDDEMKWFTIGIPIVLVVVILVIGGYIFSLQSQIDELHLLLPLDQENVFGEEPSNTPDLANDAVIENINARIDNLADTLELIANANQRTEGTQVDNSLMNSDSGASEDDKGAANPVAAVLAGEAEIRELNSRIDGLTQSLEVVTETINKQGAQIKELNIVANSKTRVVPESKESILSQRPEAKSKNLERSGAIATRDREPLKKSTGKPVEKPRKKKVAAKPSVGEGNWLVNLMSLKDEAVAKKQLASFQKKGVSAEISRTNISGKTWYRVQVSGFKSKQQAQNYAAKVKKKLGLASTWVTR